MDYVKSPIIVRQLIAISLLERDVVRNTPSLGDSGSSRQDDGVHVDAGDMTTVLRRDDLRELGCHRSRPGTYVEHLEASRFARCCRLLQKGYQKRGAVARRTRLHETEYLFGELAPVQFLFLWLIVCLRHDCCCSSYGTADFDSDCVGIKWVVQSGGKAE